MLKTKVKASSITNLTDARYFAAWEVEWLGFDLEMGSETQVSPQFVHAIKDWVEGVKVVGEFGMASADEIIMAAETMSLDMVQVSMFTSLNEVKEIKGIPVIKEIIVDNNTSEATLEEILKSFAPHCHAFILNFDKNQIGYNDLKEEMVLSISSLKGFCEEYPILVSLNFQPNSLAEFLEQIKPLGINVKGGEEEKVGFKSFDELDQIFESIEILV
jgi:phosphoribosylanthranilate isomerase